jgi:hypothetical protein
MATLFTEKGLHIHHSRTVILSLLEQQPPVGQDSSFTRPPPDNSQHSQQTNVHAPGGIRTQNLNRRAAADMS